MTGERKKYRIAYRKVRDGDEAFLLSLYASTREDVKLHQSNLSDQEQAEFIKMQFRLQDHHYRKYYPDADFLIIQLKKKDIGRLYIEEWPSQFRIIDITIDPAYRSQGIGEVVMTEWINKAAAANKNISIHVEKNNQAMHLYERLGFKITGGTEVYHLMSRAYKEEQKPISV